jgi:transposase
MRRDEGRSIKEIARMLSVSTSSVSHWVRDIPLTEEQHAMLQARNGLHERQRLARAAMATKARERPARVARHASLARLIRKRLERGGGRLELARLEATDDLA